MQRSKFYLLAIVCFAISFAMGCKEPQPPEFVKLKDWQVSRPEKGMAEIATVAVFYNPNNVSLQLREVNVDVYTGADKVGNILQVSDRVKIGKKTGFDVPLSFKFNVVDQFKILLGNIFTIVSDQKVVFKYKGYLKAQKAGISFKVPLEGEEGFTIKELRGS